MAKLINVVVDKILFYLNARNMSQYSLAQKSGLPLSTVKSIMQRRTKDINLQTLFQICYGLEISPSEFLNDKTFDIQQLDLE